MSTLVEKVMALVTADMDATIRAELIIDTVLRSTGKLGGRPKPVSNPLQTGYEPVTNRFYSPQEESSLTLKISDSECSEKNGLVTGYSFVTDGGDAWVLPDDFTAELKRAFPAIDVPAELDSARLWLISNPTKRKTATGMRRFLFSWFKRANPDAIRAKKVGIPVLARKYETPEEFWNRDSMYPVLK